jgi:hypothetical protein
MAKGDGAAIGVHLTRIVGKAKAAQYGESLAREGLVQFDRVEVADREDQSGHQLPGSEQRPDPDHAGLDPDRP